VLRGIDAPYFLCRLSSASRGSASSIGKREHLVTEALTASTASRLREAPAVRLVGLRKTFGSVVALDEVTLDIADGEFFSLLGPSGSGKTTCLRLIAGFDRPTSGRIELHGVDVSDQPPFEREVNTVFQDYALFPHMTVEQNVAYGLKVKKVAKSETAERVRAALEMVRLTGFEERKPGQLSGGQRQRVALARALVNRPRVLLLDEPLGALDLQLRHEMQTELKRIQREVGITFVYVTHDQEEALTMSDRLAVFRNGGVDQVGVPSEVYEEPGSMFVADFLGTSNFVVDDLAQRLIGTRHAHSLRPERIRVLGPGEEPPADHLSVDGVVRDVVFLGSLTRYRVEVDPGIHLVLVSQNTEGIPGQVLGANGRPVRLSFSPDALRPMGTDEPSTNTHGPRGTAS
jgi:putative spermidine/putrescine transport system ATP-binding protein